MTNVSTGNECRRVIWVRNRSSPRLQLSIEKVIETLYSHHRFSPRTPNAIEEEDNALKDPTGSRISSTFSL
jgi:hypothetical protein